MAVLNFPANPSNGDTYVENTVTYTYSGTSPNGFWQADNQNVPPAADPNVTVTGTFKVSPQGGTNGDTVCYLTNAGELKRYAAGVTLEGPFAKKVGDTFTGSVIVANNARIGIGTSSPSDPLDIETNNPSIELNNLTTGTASVIFSSNGTADGAVSYNNSNDRIEVYTGDVTGNPEVVVTAEAGGSGFVGIGTSDPEVSAEIKSDTGLQLTKGDGAKKWNFIPGAQLQIIEQVTANTILQATADKKIGIGGDPTTFSGFNDLVVYGEGVTLSDAAKSGVRFADANTTQGAIFKDHSLNYLKIETSTSDNILLSGNRVGINLSDDTPDASLHVEGQTIIETGPLTVLNSGTTAQLEIQSTSLGTTTNNALSIKTNNTDRVTISANGDVTIASSATSPKFEFNNAGTSPDLLAGGFVTSIGATDAENIASLALSGIDGSLTGIKPFVINHYGDGKAEFWNKEGSDITFQFSSNTPLLRLKEDNKVIIGVGNQATNGNNLTVRSTNETGMSLVNANSTGSNGGNSSNTTREGADVELTTANNLVIRNNESNKDIEFVTDYYNALTLLNGGAGARQVVIGGKDAYSVNNTMQLTVGDSTLSDAGVELRGSSTQTIYFTPSENPTGVSEIEHTQNSGFKFKTQTSDATKLHIHDDGRADTYTNATIAHVWNTNKAAGTTDEFLRCNSSASNTSGSGATTTLQIFTNGNIQNSNNSYGAISDRKLKKNITDASSQWDDIKSVKLKNYEFKNESMGTGKLLGVIAQDLQAISPGLVDETNDIVTSQVPVFDSEENPILDAEGNQLFQSVSNDTGETTLNVKYSVLYLKAIGALQEAMVRIEELESKVSDLES